ncbi:hypothetical protein [Lacinutrix chionoecetis]
MNKLIFLICFSSIVLGHSQDTILKYNRPFVVIEGCEDDENKRTCFNVKLTEYILENLTDSLRQKIIKRSKKDTVTLSSSLFFSEIGEIMLNESQIYSSVDSINKDLKLLLKKFPKVKPVLDEYNKGVSTHINLFQGFTIDSTRNKLIPIPNFEPKEVPFALVDKLPVFKGCHKDSTNDELNKCMNSVLNSYIQKNFRASVLANNLGLSPGINSIFLFFTIDNTGSIKLSHVRAPHPVLKSEGERLISGLPNAVEPGFLNGKAVEVPYFLPIKFVVEDYQHPPKTNKKKD